jgi:DNA-binding protein HU-beta
MNKTDLIDKVASQMEATKADATRAVEAVIDAIVLGVKDDEKVTIAGFGTFVKRKRAARLGVNPITKEKIKIKPSKTCAFRAAPALKEVL